MAVPRQWPQSRPRRVGQDAALRVHQRAYSYGKGEATCVCGPIINDHPVSSGRWLDFFPAPGHLDINAGKPVRIFIAQGGPYLSVAMGESPLVAK